MLRLADDFELPLEAVTQTFAILAKRGVGKTYTAAVLAEEMLKAGLHLVICDPVGVWWGLRTSDGGNAPGLPIVILGGDHADLPLDVDMGERIAELIVTEHISAVLDLSHFRKGEQTRFMTTFAEALYHRNREALHVILDEADAFAPQRPMKGQERMLGAIEDIVRRGRARGLGVTLITQRAAVLNKDVLTQVEVLVALRTIAPQDRDAVDAWVKVHGTPEQRAELMESLPSLPIGTAWFWSPGWLDTFQRVRVRRRETFDSSATPKAGQQTAVPQQMMALDLDWLRELLTPKKPTAPVAASKSDPVLSQRVRELERRLAEKPKVETVEVPVLQPEQIEALQTLAQEIVSKGQELLDFGRDMLAAVARFAARPTPTAKPAAQMVVVREAKPTKQRTDDDLSLKSGVRKILQTLAQRYPAAYTRAQLGTLSGYTASGGTFGNYFGQLKKAGFLQEDATGVSITEAGLNYLGSDVPAQPKTTVELLAMWRGALRAGEARMLDVLVDAYPAWLTRDDLGTRSGYGASGGTFGNYLGTLRRNGLVEAESGAVRASDALFINE